VLDSIEVGLGVVLYLVYLLGDGLLYLGFLVLLHFDLLLYLLEVVVDIFGVVQLLQPEVPFKEGYLQPVTEFYLLVFQQGPLVFSTLEVLVPVYSTVVLAPVHLGPLYADPGLVLRALRLAWVEEGAEVPDYACGVVEEHLPAWEFLLVREVVGFEPLGLGFEVVAFGEALVLLEGVGGGGLCWVGRSHVLLVGILVAGWFHLITKFELTHPGH